MVYPYYQVPEGKKTNKDTVLIFKVLASWTFQKEPNRVRQDVNREIRKEALY